MSGEKTRWGKWMFWVNTSRTEEPSEEELILHELNNAHQDWLVAQQRLEMLSSPELIDHGIYVLEAAEKKYSFYLRKAREKGIRIDIPYEKAI